MKTVTGVVEEVVARERMGICLFVVNRVIDTQGIVIELLKARRESSVIKNIIDRKRDFKKRRKKYLGREDYICEELKKRMKYRI